MNNKDQGLDWAEQVVPPETCEPGYLTDEDLKVLRWDLGSHFFYSALSRHLSTE